MSRERTSPIWVVLDDQEFTALVLRCSSCKEVLSFFGLSNKGHNYRTLKQRVDALGIDTSHLNKHYDKMVAKNLAKKTPIEDILVKDSTYNKTHLKERLLKEGILRDVCYVCGLEKIWNGKPIKMVLDHVNGINNDNRVKNLRLVCPNCNSQLDTHLGKNKLCKSYYCIDCGREIRKSSKRCPKCNSVERRKVDRPPLDKLDAEVKKFGYAAVGRKYGVSDNAVRKWLKRL